MLAAARGAARRARAPRARLVRVSLSGCGARCPQVNPLRRGLAFSFVLAEKYRVRRRAPRRSSSGVPVGGARSARAGRCACASSADRAAPAQRLFRAVLTTASGSTARTPVRPSHGGGAAGAQPADDLWQDALCRFGWYLFCFAKLHLVDQDADLNHLVDILVVRPAHQSFLHIYRLCCAIVAPPRRPSVTARLAAQAVLVVLVAHAPPERRLFALQDVAAYPHRREDGTPDILLSLTTVAKSASASSCAEYLEQVLAILPQMGDAAVPAGPPSEALAGAICYPGLLAPGRIAAAAEAASAAYIAAARVAHEEIDQRLFLREPSSSGSGGTGATAPLDPTQLTPRSRTAQGGVPHQGRATPAPMRNLSAMLATPLRPAAPAPAATPGGQLAGLRSPAGGAAAGARSPISRMFVSAQWLRQITSSFAPGEVDPQLLRYLAAADAEPAALYATLLEQAQHYSQVVFPSPQQAQAPVQLLLAASGRGSHVTPTRFGSAPSFAAATGAARPAAAPERPNLMDELAANAAVLASNQTAAAESRRAQTLALYFRMLGRILTIEEQKATSAHPPAVPGGAAGPPARPAPNFGAMLRNERILRALFSVCADCVANTMHVTSWSFPTFQHALNVLPFEAVGLVHLVADCDRELPYELKQSLGGMMDSLLERLIWEKNSGFYSHLVREKGSVPASQQPGAAEASQSAGTGAATGVSGTAGSGAGEQMLLPLRYGPVAESMPPGRPRTHCCNALAMVHRMLTRRLVAIKDRLTVAMPEDLCQAVHSLLLTALFEHTSLFYGRHADTLLICAIYGCAKAASWPRGDTPLMFREIVVAYRAMKISDTGVPPDEALWRAIPLEFSGLPGDPQLEVTRHDDLVRFYNEVFLREVKPAMLAVVRAAGLLGAEMRRDGAQPPGSPAVSGGRAARAPFAVLLTASPRRVSVAGGVGGVMVSPMRPDRAAELRSSVAAPRALYAFVGDSTSALTSPSHDLHRFNDALRTAAQRAEGAGAGDADAAAAGGDAPPSAGRDRRRALTRQELPPPTRRRISEDLA